MILLALDFETNGLDKINDRVIEVGAILYSTGQRRSLETIGYLVQTDRPISEEITKRNGITRAAVDKFGYTPLSALETLWDLMAHADAVIGQNVNRFDKPMFDSWCVRENFRPAPKLWIDTTTDIPGVVGRQLSHMAADKGFLNLFPHSAVADCQTVLKLIEDEDIDKIVERAKSPLIVIQSMQDRSDNTLASKRRFRWKPELGRRWLKVIKEMDLAAELADAPFDISLAPKEILIEHVWAD